MDKEEQIINFLKKSGQFDKDELNTFLLRSKVLPIKKGETIVKEGQFCHSIYFIHSGVISLFLLKSRSSSILNSELPRHKTTITQQNPKYNHPKTEVNIGE